jgi:hypothetical protein
LIGGNRWIITEPPWAGSSQLTTQLFCSLKIKHGREKELVTSCPLWKDAVSSFALAAKQDIFDGLSVDA